jgi:hypothetical protein
MWGEEIWRLSFKKVKGFGLYSDIHTKLVSSVQGSVADAGII